MLPFWCKYTSSYGTIHPWCQGFLHRCVSAGKRIRFWLALIAWQVPNQLAPLAAFKKQSLSYHSAITFAHERRWSEGERTLKACWKNLPLLFTWLLDDRFKQHPAILVFQIVPLKLWRQKFIVSISRRVTVNWTYHPIKSQAFSIINTLCHIHNVFGKALVRHFLVFRLIAWICQPRFAVIY